jgi:hypothetical protein
VTNDSSTGGPLASFPAFALGTPPPGYAGLGLGALGALPNFSDDDLDSILQNILAGIIGLDPTMVRPRWQPETPNVPAYGTNWASIGITYIDADIFDWQGHFPDYEGYNIQYRTEELTVQCSFYGPNCEGYCRRLRESLQVAQNLEPLQQLGIGLISTGRITVVPTLLKERWLRRCDLSVQLRRAIINFVPILNLESASVQVTTDQPAVSTSITIQESP